MSALTHRVRREGQAAAAPSRARPKPERGALGGAAGAERPRPPGAPARRPAGAPPAGRPEPGGRPRPPRATRPPFRPALVTIQRAPNTGDTNGARNHAATRWAAARAAGRPAEGTPSGRS